MEETISVAMRVAEEAIDEAIAKAESQTNSQVRLSLYKIIYSFFHSFILDKLASLTWQLFDIFFCRRSRTKLIICERTEQSW